MSRVLLAAIGVACLILVTARAQSERIDLPWGFIELSNNEISIVSTVEDPPAVRFAAARGGSLGKASWNVYRTDGRQEEIALIQGKLDERYRRDPQALAGEITWHVRRPYASGDGAMVAIETMRYDGVVFHVPVYQERRLATAPAAVAPFLRATNGQYEAWMQNDGNVVSYRVFEGRLCPTWSAWTGALPPCE